ncbi:family 69 glycosyltransferase [Cercophora newfieldiana]|uniref:Family 69 glycosyltransferase n=1 Tax=Cercophora newfieldiana TaxID=92897 RepID=A0AA40CN16_9PEZI|nr:family 69 glycosyltransferase [Cercophora newfieldiana]
MPSLALDARRNARIIILAALISLAVVTLALNRDRFVRASSGVIQLVSPKLSRKLRDTYVHSIMDPSATDLPRLECPQSDLTRYEYLKEYGKEIDPGAIQYYFAIDLRQTLPLLPRLLGSVVEVIRFLGPERCYLSIVEGNSDDGTPEVLDALQRPLMDLNTTYTVSHVSTDPSEIDRIHRLALLRNDALSALLPPADPNPSSKPLPTTPTTTIIFLNDVAICPEDILELVHQRIALNATMTCAMDWTYAGENPTFYDVWVARTLAGDSFFEIPSDGNWNSAWNLFWNDTDTLSRYTQRKPFQVFSCWNGAVAIAAEPIVKGEIKFRGPNEELEECFQGEPQLFCKDLWWKGYGKIAVVPAVNLEYSDEKAERIKKLKGYTSQWRVDEGIEWRTEPPEKVKCMPNWEHQSWQAWNESLPGVG